MKRNSGFNFWVFTIGISTLLIGALRLLVSWRYLSCDAWRIGTKCVVPQTNLGWHIALDTVNVLLDLFIVGVGIALIVHTLRPLFKKKSAPDSLPQFLGAHVLKFYANHPTSKCSYVVGLTGFIIMGLFIGFFVLMGLFELVNCYVLHTATPWDASTFGLFIVSIVCTLIPTAGIWLLYQLFKKPIFYVSEEGLLYQGEFVLWKDVKRMVCIKNPTRYRGTYLELLHAKEIKPKWLFRPQSEIYLMRYYALSLASREAFKQAVRTYIPVEEE